MHNHRHWQQSICWLREGQLSTFLSLYELTFESQVEKTTFLINSIPWHRHHCWCGWVEMEKMMSKKEGIKIMNFILYTVSMFHVPMSMLCVILEAIEKIFPLHDREHFKNEWMKDIAKGEHLLKCQFWRTRLIRIKFERALMKRLRENRKKYNMQNEMFVNQSHMMWMKKQKIESIEKRNLKWIFCVWQVDLLMRLLWWIISMSIKIFYNFSFFFSLCCANYRHHVELDGRYIY